MKYKDAEKKVLDKSEMMNTHNGTAVNAIKVSEVKEILKEVFNE